MVSESSQENAGVGWVGKAWIVTIFGYSALRALVVWPTLSTYGVNPWIFLVIDVGTAWILAGGRYTDGLEGQQRSGARVKWGI